MKKDFAVRPGAEGKGFLYQKNLRPIGLYQKCLRCRLLSVNTVCIHVHSIIEHYIPNGVLITLAALGTAVPTIHS